MKQTKSHTELMIPFEKQGLNKEIFMLISTILKYPLLKQRHDQLPQSILEDAIAKGFIKRKGNDIQFTELSSKFVRAVVEFGRQKGRIL